MCLRFESEAFDAHDVCACAGFSRVRCLFECARAHELGLLHLRCEEERLRGGERNCCLKRRRQGVWEKR